MANLLGPEGHKLHGVAQSQAAELKRLRELKQLREELAASSAGWPPSSLHPDRQVTFQRLPDSDEETSAARASKRSKNSPAGSSTTPAGSSR